MGRYLKTGGLDKQFGNGEGRTTLPPGLEPRLILQSDGKVLITYQTATPHELRDFKTPGVSRPETSLARRHWRAGHT